MRTSLAENSWASAIRCAAVLSAAGFLCGCHKPPLPAETQVAVRVNSSEISVHQVQAVLERQPRLVAAAGESAAPRIVELLIDQELAAQAAREQNLDADPQLIQATQASKREALARAYHDRISAGVSAPSSDEIDRYYASQPALFAKRRLYILQEAAVEATEAQLATLRQAVQQTRSADELAKTLGEAGLKHSSRMLAQAAEDLPLMLLEPLAELEVGRSAFFPRQGGARIFTVIDAHMAPVDRRTATEAIANYLVAERRRQAVAEATRLMRKAATLEYQGAFAGPAGGAPTPVPVGSAPN